MTDRSKTTLPILSAIVYVLISILYLHAIGHVNDGATGHAGKFNSIYKRKTECPGVALNGGAVAAVVSPRFEPFRHLPATARPASVFLYNKNRMNVRLQKPTSNFTWQKPVRMLTCQRQL